MKKAFQEKKLFLLKDLTLDII